MKFIQTGKTNGDCCAPCDVSNYKARTVGEFVEEVVHECGDDWGDVEVWKQGEDLWNCPKYEYKHGVITSDPSEDLSKLKIKKITAYGGWSYMSYTIEIEEE